MSLTKSLPDGRVEPSLVLQPSGAAHHEAADETADLYRAYWRRPLMPSQLVALRVGMSETPTGHWAAPTFARMVSRQNAKTDEIEARELYGLLRGEAIVHTAHEFPAARQSFTRLLGVINGSDDLRRLVRKVYNGGTGTSIEFRKGGIIVYRARAGGKGGRGLDDISLVVYDEAQHLEAEHLAASSPTLAVNPNPQTWIAGTSAIVGRSDVWWPLRMRALRGESAGFGYVEHSAEAVYLDGKGALVSVKPDPDDIEAWAAANPGLGRTIDHRFLRSQLALMGPDLFAREHLGVWDPPPDDGMRLVKLPANSWAATGISAHEATTRFPDVRVFAFDVSLDGAWSSVAFAGGSLQAPYVEVFEHKQGVGWLPARLTELAVKHPEIQFVCNGAGPAGAQVGPVLAAFAEAKVSTERLTQLSAVEYKQACGGFYTDVTEGRLKRPAEGQGPLDVAAGDATERTLGDAWAWDIRSATVPISPLVAVTLARALLPMTAADTAYAY